MDNKYLISAKAFCCLCLFIFPLLASAAVDQPVLQLTAKEKKWLATHKSIRVAYDGSFAPYSFIDESGNLEGIAVDFMALLSRRLGIDFVTYPKTNWDDIYKAVVDQQADVIATMVDRPDRYAWFNFTKPYLTKSLVIVTKKTNDSIKTRKDILAKSVALNENYEYTERIIKEFPKIKAHWVKSMKEGFDAVNSEQSDAVITFLATANYLQLNYPYPDLKVADFFERDSANESIAVRKDWPVLTDILQKALDSVTEEEKQLIFAKWMPQDKPKEVVAPVAKAPPVPQPVAVAPTPEKNNYLTGGNAYINLAVATVLLLWVWQSKRQNRKIRQLTQAAEDANLKVASLQSDLEHLALTRTMELNSTEYKFRNLLENLRNEYFFYQRDNQGEFTYVSPSVTYILGYSAEDFMEHYRDYLTENPINQKMAKYTDLCALGVPSPAYELEIVDSKRGIHWLEIIDAPIYDEYGNCTGIDGFVHDITSRKQRLIRLSYYDELTGFATQRLFDDRIQQISRLADRQNTVFALVYLQLGWMDSEEDDEDEDEITDGEIIKESADRLLLNLRQSDVVSRLNQDSFALILTETDVDSAVLVAKKILVTLVQPYILNSKKFVLSPHIGIAIYPKNSKDGEELVRQAENAMILAKQKKTGIVVYSDGM